jgi:hypothetical protein
VHAAVHMALTEPTVQFGRLPPVSLMLAQQNGSDWVQFSGALQDTAAPPSPHDAMQAWSKPPSVSVTQQTSLPVHGAAPQLKGCPPSKGGGASFAAPSTAAPSDGETGASALPSTGPPVASLALPSGFSLPVTELPPHAASTTNASARCLVAISPPPCLSLL